jgi:hypothetical protein
MEMDIERYGKILLKKEKVVIQCAKCNSEGEVDITDDVLKDLEKMTRLQ